MQISDERHTTGDLEWPNVPGGVGNSKGRRRFSRMMMGGRDVPGRRKDWNKGREEGEHKEGLRVGDRLAGPAPTRKACWGREVTRSVFQKDLCGEASWA